MDESPESFEPTEPLRWPEPDGYAAVWADPSERGGEPAARDAGDGARRSDLWGETEETWPYVTNGNVSGKSFKDPARRRMGGDVLVALSLVMSFIVMLAMVPAVSGDCERVLRVAGLLRSLGLFWDEDSVELLLILLAMAVPPAIALVASAVLRRRSMNVVKSHVREHSGAAFPLVSRRDCGEPSVQAVDGEPLCDAWRVEDAAGPIHASRGRVLTGVTLRECTAMSYYQRKLNRGTYIRKWDYETSLRTLHFFLVEFTDNMGRRHVCWSDAHWGWFDQGEQADVYWYEARDSMGRAFIRIHDVAAASRSPDAERHAVRFFNLYEYAYARSQCRQISWLRRLMEQTGYSTYPDVDWIHTWDLRPGGPFGREALRGSWGRRWCWNTIVGYGDDPRDRADFTHGDDYAILLPPLPDLTAVRGRGDTENLHGIHIIYNVRRRMEFRGVEGRAEDVVTVPLFSGQRYRGMGYMAKVAYEWHGVTRRAWALCDPSRNDSYLGRDPTDLARPPIRMGAPVLLFTRPRGLALVTPCTPDTPLRRDESRLWQRS